VSSIIFDTANLLSGNSDLDDFLVNLRLYRLKIAEFADNVKNIDKYFLPLKICDSIYRDYKGIGSGILMKSWIPYTQFTDIKKIAEGGFGIIYKATWLDGSSKNKTIILKRFKNSQDISKYFLNEVNILIFVLLIQCLIKLINFNLEIYS